MLMILAALCAGGFATTGVLWFSGAGALNVAASARLNKLRETDVALPTNSKSSLRTRGAVNFAGITLLSGNLASTWTKDLERAGLALTAKEYLIVRSVVALVISALIMAVAPVPALALVGLPFGWFATGFWVKRKKSSRLHKLEAQMVEMLQMLSSGLRAGFGLLQALEAASDQSQAPLQTELRRTMRDTAMGASVEQALTSFNERVGSADFDIVITAILIQRSVGGNLAEILDNMQQTMRERERIRGEIRTLTSQQRLTGYVIGGIPVGLLLAIYVDQPSIHFDALH